MKYIISVMLPQRDQYYWEQFLIPFNEFHFIGVTSPLYFLIIYILHFFYSRGWRWKWVAWRKRFTLHYKIHYVWETNIRWQVPQTMRHTKNYTLKSNCKTKKKQNKNDEKIKEEYKGLLQALSKTLPTLSIIFILNWLFGAFLKVYLTLHVWNHWISQIFKCNIFFLSLNRLTNEIFVVARL